MELSDTDQLRGSGRLLLAGADRLAAEVQRLVERGVISSRSEAADALLDYDHDGNDAHRQFFGFGPREGRFGNGS